MKTLRIDNGFSETRTFEIVEQLPNDNHYVVWNIGRENFPFKRFIPLCTCDKNYHVYIESLKAFECPSEEKALEIIEKAKRGTVDMKKAKEIINK